MASKCDFCENSLKSKEGYVVKEVVLDRNPGIIKLTDVLIDLYFSELDVSKICAECLDTISKQFIFKQKLRKNLKMPQSKTIIGITKFLAKNKEISIAEHFDVLTIYPDRRKDFVTTMHSYAPHVLVSDKPPKDKITELIPQVKLEKIKPSTPKNVTFDSSTIFKNSISSSEEEDTDDSNYGDKKSRKRKKNKSHGKSKKQKLNHNNSIVKQEITPSESSEQEEFDDEYFTVNRIEQPWKRSVLNPTRLKSLTNEQKEWLCMTIRDTERCGKTFVCKFCFKYLNSEAAIRYHYINRHLLKTMNKKQIWVASKVKEGLSMVQREDGKFMTLWKCTECSKTYNNHPGLRYHLSTHLADDYNETLDI